MAEVPRDPGSARRPIAATRVVAVTRACEEWFFELRLAHPLPTVDLTRTLAGTLLSPAHYEWFLGIARNKHHLISRVTRILSLVYLGILFPSSPVVRACITYVLFLSVVPLVFVIGLLSLDVVAVLVKSSYEYWFLSLLNAVHWLTIAFVFNDVRSFMCLASWVSLQTALSLDANFRTFAAATKTVSSAVPGMILIGTLCAMRYIADGRYFVVTSRSLMFSSGDIMSFTSSTLAIFMIKLAIRKHLSKSGHSSLDCAIVHCVMLKARLELSPKRERPRLKGRVTIRAVSTAFGTISTHAKQPVKLHGLARFVVDARRMLLPGMLTRVWRWSRVFNIAFYTAGTIGVVATAATWIAVLCFQVSADARNKAVTTMSAIGAACFLAFVTLFVGLAQRDLLWTLAYTFDFNFSVFQAASLALCLADMSRWEPAVCLAALSWWLWFQWVLLLDAVPPAARTRMGFTKKLAAPVMVLVLFGAVLLAVRLIYSDSRLDGMDPRSGERPSFGLLRNRRLIHWQPSEHHDFELRTFDFSLQRVLTILGWSSRLAVALVTGGEHELLFLRGFTRYATPFDTFPPNANAHARRRLKTVAVTRSNRVLPNVPPAPEAPSHLG